MAASRTRGRAAAGVAPPGRVPAPRHPPPSTIILGSSIVRNVRLRGGRTYCFPGACVSDILERLPEALQRHRDCAKIVVHVGSNDTRKQQSEVLKADFRLLLSALESSGKNFLISGPIPTLGLGYGRFSRLLSLHSWLKGECTARGAPYIDNFDLFWNRKDFFREDGLHPNYNGARHLSANMDFAVQQSGAGFPRPAA